MADMKIWRVRYSLRDQNMHHDEFYMTEERAVDEAAEFENVGPGAEAFVKELTVLE